MTKDSTQQQLHCEIKSTNMKKPQMAKLDFIRQFARAYRAVQEVQASSLILN